MREPLPDLVLMDVSMPVMDGFTSAPSCASCRAARVPVVMMTGLDDVQSIERAFEVGATDFITKPINWPILAHRVRYMLRASAAARRAAHAGRERLANAQRLVRMGNELQIELPMAPSCTCPRSSSSLRPVLRGGITVPRPDHGRARLDDRAPLRAAVERALERRAGAAHRHRVRCPTGPSASCIAGDGSRSTRTAARSRSTARCRTSPSASAPRSRSATSRTTTA